MFAMHKDFSRALAGVLVSAVLGAVAAIGSTRAAAEVVVIGSDVAKYRSGATLPDSETIDVPRGGTVRVLLVSGRTEVLKGPKTIAVKELGKGEARDESLFRQIVGMVRPAASTTEQPGAVRSAAPTSDLPASFSWKDVPVDADGDYCVERGASLSLTRRSSRGDQKLTLVDVAAAKRVDVEFRSGERAAPWPKEMPPKIANYALIGSSGPMRTLRLRLISPLPGKDQALRVLHGQKCAVQMEALVRAMADPKY